ncbi:MAG: hypothetical protein II707_00530 [Spirochaetales bacterium]|nr:hypothetical protein [Spirochaetales bacterium]
MLIDTNVILDVLLNREQFVDAAVTILKLSEDEVQKFVSASLSQIFITWHIKNSEISSLFGNY